MIASKREMFQFNIKLPALRVSADRATMPQTACVRKSATKNDQTILIGRNENTLLKPR